jgi:hypothetical protein
LPVYFGHIRPAGPFESSAEHRPATAQSCAAVPWCLKQVTQPKATKTAIGRFEQISTCVGKRAIQVKDHTGFEHILASLAVPIAKNGVCAKQLVDFHYTLKRAPLFYKGLRSANEYRTHHSCRRKRHPNAI